MHLVMLATCDLSAILRGRAVVAERAAGGCGWVPANHALLPLGGIAASNPFGSIGDLRLRPDAATRATVPGDDDATPLDIVLCDVVDEHGAPWDRCARGALTRMLATLERDHGMRVRGAFEHEFQLSRRDDADPAFSLAALRAADPLGPAIVTAFEDAGLEPETFLPEYGAGQFEVTVAPAEGLSIADRAVLARAIVHDVARRCGHSVTFTPLADVDGVGNGAHLHLSLWNPVGEPLLHDPARPAALSALGGSFTAGILRHADALVAVCAPSAVSALRLRPHRWSAAGAFLGEQDREAFVRIPASSGGDHHLELRVPDATANPYLSLAAIVAAGAAGLGDGLPTPALGPHEAPSLPKSLGAALDALERDDLLVRALGEPLVTAHVALKRAELDAVAGLDADEICRRYARVY